MSEKILNEVLYEVIPYRLQALETLVWAYDKSHDLPPPRDLRVVVDGKAILGGNVNAVLNPIIEVGAIYARSLIEFLGLKARNGQLSDVGRRGPDDIGIEDFKDRSGTKLPRVTREEVFAAYAGPKEQAERALMCVIHLSGKSVAHMSSWEGDGYTEFELKTACNGINALMKRHLYNKLGIPIPQPPRPSRQANES